MSTTPEKTSGEEKYDLIEHNSTIRYPHLFLALPLRFLQNQFYHDRYLQLL